MTDKVEIQGKTVDEAVSEALLRMGARRDEVDVTVLEEPRTGFLGLVGNRPARVIVRRRHTGSRRRKAGFLQNDADHQPHDLGGGDARGERGRGGRGRASGRTADAETGRGGRGRGGESRRTDRQGGSGDASRDEPRGKRTGRRGGRRGGNAATENEEIKTGAAGRGDANASGDDAGADDARSSRRRRGRRGGRGRSSGRRDQRQAAAETERENVTEVTAATPAADDGPENREDAVRAETGDSGREVRSRRGRSRGGRGGRRRSERSPAAETAADEAPAAARGNGAGDDAGPAGPAQPAATVTDEEMIATGIKALSYAQPQSPTSADALDGALTDLASGMLVRAGFPCRCEVKPGEYRLVKVVTDDTSAGMLIGRHGQTIDAVEHLVERMISTAAGDRVRMNLDINNYRRRRQDSLVERVAQIVAEVQATGNDVHLEPMDARERRICHLEAALTDGLRTWTVNGPGGKHVVIGIDDGTDQAEDIEPVEIGEDDENDRNEQESASAADQAEEALGADSTETVLLDADSLDLPDDDLEQERPGAGS